MKHFILICTFFVMLVHNVIAQNVGIGTNNPNASAILDLNSTNKGLLPPRMTFAQRNAISNPTPGLIIWCTDCGSTGELCVFNGISWKSASITETIAPNPCVGVSVSTNAVPTATVPCSTITNNGSVALSATGGTSPYQYNFNNTGFSSTTSITGLAAGNYTVISKDANGCTSSTQTVTVGTASAGPLFTAVKNIINSRCSGCHTGGGASGGVSFSTDCNIVSKAARIKARAVDNVPSVMPPSGAIPNTEKQAITNWINAGGQFNQ